MNSYNIHRVLYYWPGKPEAVSKRIAWLWGLKMTMRAINGGKSMRVKSKQHYVRIRSVRQRIYVFYESSPNKKLFTPKLTRPAVSSGCILSIQTKLRVCEITTLQNSTTAHATRYAPSQAQICRQTEGLKRAREGGRDG